MRKIFICILVVAMIVILPAYANAELGFRSNSKISLPADTPISMPPRSPNPDYQSASKSSIKSTSKGIQLRFQDYPLGELLKNIHDETGIRFNLSSQMTAIPVSVNVAARNWKNSVQKLIADYSRVEVWTNQPKTSQIWLMEGKPYN